MAVVERGWLWWSNATPQTGRAQSHCPRPWGVPPQPSMKELLSSRRRCGFLAVGSTLIPLAVGVGRPGPVPFRDHDVEFAHPRPSSELEAEGGPSDDLTSTADVTTRDALPSIRGRDSRITPHLTGLRTKDARFHPHGGRARTRSPWLGTWSSFGSSRPPVGGSTKAPRVNY